jgi:hypothetical protein
MQIPINFMFKKDTSLKERTLEAMGSLEIEIRAMHHLRNRLQTTLSNSLTLGNRDDRPFAPNLVGDSENLINLVNIVKHAEVLLQNLSVKMDSVLYLQEFVTILDSAMRSARILKSDVSRIVPAIDHTLDKVSTSLVEMKTELMLYQPPRENYDLPLVVPKTDVELPLVVNKCSSIGATNLTTFTTAVHTQI